MADRPHRVVVGVQWDDGLPVVAVYFARDVAEAKVAENPTGRRLIEYVPKVVEP